MTAEQTVIQFQLHGHQPSTFKGQKLELLNALLAHRGEWIPAFELGRIALQYNARVYELREAGYRIENMTRRVGGQVHGSFRLVSCPGETDTSSSLAAGGQ